MLRTGDTDQFARLAKEGQVLAAITTAALLWFRAVPTPLLSITARLLGGIAIVLAIALGVDGTLTL